VPAIADDCHQGVPPQLAHRYHNSTFADDNGLVDTHTHMIGAIDNSVRSAYDIFGQPHDDHHPPCLSEEKWHEVASHVMQYLGFHIDICRMTMAWPVDKRLQLATMLDDMLPR